MISVPDRHVIAGRYKVDARLGAGAFGTVYRVTHEFLGALALKVVPYTTESHLMQLTREGATHARLAHPNITRIYDLGVDDLNGEKFVYIVSEYMALGTLEDHLAIVGRTELPEWKTLCRDILSALSYAHERKPPILHRDITLANILVGGTASRPEFKLGDFGISVELAEEVRVARAAGTLLFLAPECAFGSYLVESDLYSAAVVFYKALTGAYPFPVGVLGDPARFEAKREALPPSRLLLGCQPELDAAILRGLSPDPFARYSSAREFSDAVLGAAHSEDLPRSMNSPEYGPA